MGGVILLALFFVLGCLLLLFPNQFRLHKKWMTRGGPFEEAFAHESANLNFRFLGCLFVLFTIVATACLLFVPR
jgi:hypothetical protein